MGLALRVIGLELERGAQPPHLELHVYGGALPRLTSGGKAESLPAQDIWGGRHASRRPAFNLSLRKEIIPMEELESLREAENLRFRFQMNNRLRLESLAAVSKVFREFGEPISDDLLSSLVFAVPNELIVSNGVGYVTSATTTPPEQHAVPESGSYPPPPGPKDPRPGEPPAPPPGEPPAPPPGEPPVPPPGEPPAPPPGEPPAPPPGEPPAPPRPGEPPVPPPKGPPPGP